MVGAILNDINASMGKSDKISWVLSGWAIASTVSVVLLGKLSDIFGRRYIMLFGVTVSLAGAVLLCLSFS